MTSFKKCPKCNETPTILAIHQPGAKPTARWEAAAKCSCLLIKAWGSTNQNARTMAYAVWLESPKLPSVPPPLLDGIF